MARKVFGPAARMEAAEAAEAGGEPAAPPPARKPLARGGAGAPRYMQGSAEAVSARSHEDIPVSQIQASAIEDRIDLTEDLEQLMASIEANGQQIPVIVRIVNQERPYEIVAGRRRLEAIRRLGRPTVRGFVTRMSDEEAFVAQGIENSARLETSFIERARTAVKAADAGYGQQQIGEFLAIQQSLISMMTAIYNRIGEDLVRAIGPARGVGRRKWERLSRLLDERGIEGAEAAALVDPSIPGSADRFEALLAQLDGSGEPPALPDDAPAEAPAPADRPAAAPRRRRRHFGGAFVSTRAPGKLTIKASDEEDGFLDYLADRIDEIRERFNDDGGAE